jgi:acetoin utilization deacetylase AcuC-like enzyme
MCGSAGAATDAYRTGVPATRPPWLRHDASLGHDIPGHPERPERIRALEAEMARRGWFGCELIEAPAAARALLLAVHAAAHVDAIEALCARGGGMIDADTMAVPSTWEAALHAAGGAARLVDVLLGDGARAGVSALRPPGHHAEPARAMGFCFFDNVAVAARRARDAHGVERVLVLDWDVHHGNGTNEIFRADPSVLFVSIHEWPLYPGTGPASDAGSGPGEGYTVNLPVPGGTGDAGYRSLVEHVACGLIAEWQPQLVLVSAGFDAHRDDPLATCRVTEAGYAGMTASLRRACDAVGAPVGLVLEGGYDLGALSRSMAALMPVLVAEEAPVGEAVVPRHPLAEQALARLARWWPGLEALGRP